MAKTLHQKPSSWLTHLNPLEAYHLDHALFVRWALEEAARQEARGAGQPAPPARPRRDAPPAGPANGMRRARPEEHARFAGLLDRYKRGETGQREVMA